MPYVAKPYKDRWTELAEYAMAHPNQWCSPDFYLDHARKQAYSIRNGKVVAFRPAHHWLARCRNYRLEVMYIGGTNGAGQSETRPVP